MGKGPEQTLFQRRYTNSQQVYEKMFNISNHQGNGNQNQNLDIILHLLGWLLQKCQKITSVHKDVEKREHLYTVGGNVNWYSHYGKQFLGSSKFLNITTM